MKKILIGLVLLSSLAFGDNEFTNTMSNDSTITVLYMNESGVYENKFLIKRGDYVSVDDSKIVISRTYGEAKEVFTVISLANVVLVTGLDEVD